MSIVVHSGLASSRPVIGRLRRGAAALAASLISLAVSGCSSDSGGSDGTTRVWIGGVTGSDIAVGLVESSASGHAVLFFCGGPSSFTSATHWFTDTSVSNTQFSVSEAGWTVSGVESATEVAGMVQSDAIAGGPFSLEPVRAGTLSGLYDATAPCGHIGLIVAQGSAGDAPHAQGTCLSVVAGVPSIEQVNPVMPLARDASGGIAVAVASSPGQTFIVHPLALPGQ